MNVAVVAGYSPSLINFRGHLLRTMTSAGHRVAALAPADDPSTAEALQAMGVEFLPLGLRRQGLNPFLDLASLAELYSMFKKIKPDKILSYTIKPVIYGSLAARLAGAGEAYSLVTGLGYAFGGRGPWRGLLAGAVKALYRLALKKNRAVFFQNPEDRDFFARAGLLGPDQRTAVLPGSGVDLSHFSASPLPAGPMVFVCVARLLREKGLAEFARAAEMLRPRHPGAEFVLVGPREKGPGAVTDRELALWQDKGGLKYLGPVTDVRPHLASATVFVLPSYYREGAPRSIMEAMAAGRAVITSDAPGCRQMVAEGRTGLLVPPRDPEALARAMERFILEPGLAADMGRAGRVLAEERFDVRLVTERLMREMGLC
ncbi:MAG: glycosyltransferase family 4 protein [Desulfovibrionaceae bacterium]|nr:glycosyltransferase family 4 protein [Desulfovibrionaceae bacterium]